MNPRTLTHLCTGTHAHIWQNIDMYTCKNASDATSGVALQERYAKIRRS